MGVNILRYVLLGAAHKYFKKSKTKEYVTVASSSDNMPVRDSRPIYIGLKYMPVGTQEEEEDIL